MNAYWMLQEIHANIDDSTESHWSDGELMRKLNMSYSKAFRTLLQSSGDQFVKKTTLTPSASLITLPSDFMKFVSMEEVSSGIPIPLEGTVRERRVDRGSNNSLTMGWIRAFFVGDTIEVNQDNYETQVYLWYTYRIPALHAGTAGSQTAATLLHLDSSNYPNRNDDYYNLRGVEVVDGAGTGIVDTITDYDGTTMIATITGTPGSGDHYGTTSQLPVEADEFIIMDATMSALAKPSAAFDTNYFQYMMTRWKDSKREWLDWIASRKDDNLTVRITEDLY